MTIGWSRGSTDSRTWRTAEVVSKGSWRGRCVLDADPAGAGRPEGGDLLQGRRVRRQGVRRHVDAWHARMSAAGLPVTPLQEEPWGMREFTLTDPSGNHLRIGRATDRPGSTGQS